MTEEATKKLDQGLWLRRWVNIACLSFIFARYTQDIKSLYKK